MKWDFFQFCTKNSCLSKKNNFRIFKNKILIILSWGFFWGTFSVIFSVIYFVISEANFIFITSFIYFYTYLIYPGVTLNLQKKNQMHHGFFLTQSKSTIFSRLIFNSLNCYCIAHPDFFTRLSIIARESPFFTIVHHTVDFDPIFVAKIMKETS